MATDLADQGIRTIDIQREVDFAAPLGNTFAAALEELGPGAESPDGTPFSMVVEP